MNRTVGIYEVVLFVCMLLGISPHLCAVTHHVIQRETRPAILVDMTFFAALACCGIGLCKICTREAARRNVALKFLLGGSSLALYAYGCRTYAINAHDKVPLKFAVGLCCGYISLGCAQIFESSLETDAKQSSSSELWASRLKLVLHSIFCPIFLGAGLWYGTCHALKL